MYQPRGTRRMQRVRQETVDRQARRALYLAAQERPQPAAEPFSVVAALLAMSEEVRRD